MEHPAGAGESIGGICYFWGELLSKSMVMLDFSGTNSPRLAVGNRGTCWQFQVVAMFDQVREDHAMTKPTIFSSKHVRRWAWQSTLSTSDTYGAIIETEEKPSWIWTCCCSWFLFGVWFMIFVCVCVEFPSRRFQVWNSQQRFESVWWFVLSLLVMWYPLPVPGLKLTFWTGI